MQTILKEEGYPFARFHTYISMIKGSVDSNQYRELFVETPEGLVDVIGDGDLACAYFVSSILSHFNLIQGRPHTTVDETIADLEASGWRTIKGIVLGCVIVWVPKDCSDGKQHRHIGFYVDNFEAISNDPIKKSPQKHHATFGMCENKPTRMIEKVYYHPDFTHALWHR